MTSTSTALCPGGVATPMLREVVEAYSASPARRRRRIFDKMLSPALIRHLEPAEVARRHLLPPLRRRDAGARPGRQCRCRRDVLLERGRLRRGGERADRGRELGEDAGGLADRRHRLADRSPASSGSAATSPVENRMPRPGRSLSASVASTRPSMPGRSTSARSGYCTRSTSPRSTVSAEGTFSPRSCRGRDRRAGRPADHAQDRLVLDQEDRAADGRRSSFSPLLLGAALPPPPTL